MTSTLRASSPFGEMRRECQGLRSPVGSYHFLKLFVLLLLIVNSTIYARRYSTKLYTERLRREIHPLNFYICCGSILSLVQILFSFVSSSLSCHFHTQKQKKRKFEPRIKLNHNIYHFGQKMQSFPIPSSDK